MIRKETTVHQEVVVEVEEVEVEVVAEVEEVDQLKMFLRSLGQMMMIQRMRKMKKALNQKMKMPNLETHPLEDGDVAEVEEVDLLKM